MIYKMSKFPHNVTIYKPIPRHRGFYKCIRFKKTDTKKQDGEATAPGSLRRMTNKIVNKTKEIL